MIIPKRLKLLGHTIEVTYRYDIFASDDLVGMAEYRTNTIQILPSSNARPRSQTQMEETFLHELVHFILFYMEEEDLRKNEKFVGLFSNLLHQALTTAETVPEDHSDASPIGNA